MSRIRSSMILLGICVAALLIGLLRLATQRPPMPVGSSYSTDANGAQALYEWSAATGGRPARANSLTSAGVDSAATVLVVQPETTLDSEARAVLSDVLRRGGRVVVAGDSVAWVLYARLLGISIEPIRPAAVVASTPDAALSFSTVARYRVRAPDADPLLITPDGDWLAVRQSHGGGTLIVLATPEPLLNGALRDDGAARFAFREILAPDAGGRLVLFDEAHRGFIAPTADGATVTFNDLLFSTAAGRAVVYAAALIFMYLVLTGRRMGPPVHPRSAVQTSRTMFEHVQMVANLYRRTGQLAAARAAFAQFYGRRLTQLGLRSTRQSALLAHALARIEAARSEAELVAAVAAASDAG